MAKEVSIVVPGRNEEEILNNFFKELLGYADSTNLDYEVIFVESGSSDGTFEIASGWSKKNQRVKALQFPEPGYGKAIKFGLEEAVGKYLITFNVDFWDKKFIEICNADLLGYDIVLGSKTLPRSEDHRPILRRIVTRAFNLFLKFIFGFRGTDTHGIKALRKETIIPVVKDCKTESGIFDTEFILRAERKGLKILELPVSLREIRTPRIPNRILDTPKDVIDLYLALRK